MPTPLSPAPFITPIAGDLDQRLSLIVQAINRKADIATIPTYAAIHLIAPDGSTWMLSIDSTGTLHTAQMPRP